MARRRRITAPEAVGILGAVGHLAVDVAALADGVDPGELERVLRSVDRLRDRIEAAREEEV